MKATYSRVEVYTVNARCETPLRTGQIGDCLEIVLYRHDGKAMIQGTSIAGALRAWCEANNMEETEKLFGSLNRAGHLVISDGIFSSEAEMEQRPRVSIDGSSGSVKNGGKYDVAHILAGSEFTFSITWLGDSESINEIKNLENILAALNSGEIQFGAYKTNGFGIVSLNVYKQSYDLKNMNDRKEWLEESKKKVRVVLPESKFLPYIRFSVDGSVDGLLVKSATDFAKNDTTGNTIVNIKEDDKMVLPASSIKGAVRSRAETIIDYMNIGNDIANRAFGNSERSGSVYFKDVILDLTPNRQSRIRINYFTGGVINRALFNEEYLSGNLKIDICVKADKDICALVLLALRDLGLGLYNIGSGMAIGRGFINVSSIKATEMDGNIAYLKFDKNKKMTVDDSAGIFANWLDKLREDIYEGADEC